MLFVWQLAKPNLNISSVSIWCSYEQSTAVYTAFVRTLLMQIGSHQTMFPNHSLISAIAKRMIELIFENHLMLRKPIFLLVTTIP